MLREIRDLGFEYAELSHGIRISLLPGVFEAVDSGEIKISTLHNFCPLPMGVTHAAPNIFKFSSLDPRERESAFRHTVKTFETAQRVKAKVVVLHLGCIEMKDYTERLVDLLEKGQKESPKYEKICQEALLKQEEKKARHVQAVREMLPRLIAEAEPRGLKLGIENREALEEIPLDRDFENFLRDFDHPVVGYWHDTGHAQIKHHLGFIHHRLQLETLAPRLLGFHIHDVQFPARDHRSPGTGSIDFSALKPLQKPEHIKVFEFSPGLTIEEVKSGVAHVRVLWDTP